MGASAICRIIALILFAIAAAPLPLPGNAVALGLFMWLLSEILVKGAQ